jgi:hypothetical protein
LGRAGQWSLRLACAAQGWHASRGRLSSEGLDGALGRSVPAALHVAATDRMTVLARGFADMPRILLAEARRRTWRGWYSAGAATDRQPGVALCASPVEPRALDCGWSLGPQGRVNPMSRDNLPMSGALPLSPRFSVAFVKHLTLALALALVSVQVAASLLAGTNSRPSEPRRPSQLRRASHLAARQRSSITLSWSRRDLSGA